MKRHIPEIKELSEYALNYARNKQTFFQLINGQINMTYTYMTELLAKPIAVMKNISNDMDEVTRNDFEETCAKIKALHDKVFQEIHNSYEELKEQTQSLVNGFVARYNDRKDPNSIFKEE